MHAVNMYVFVYALRILPLSIVCDTVLIVRHYIKPTVALIDQSFLQEYRAVSLCVCMCDVCVVCVFHLSDVATCSHFTPPCSL